MSLALSLRSVSKVYSTGGHSFKALDQVDLDIEEGKLVVILGPSGAGKSTLLNLIGGMDIPSDGTIRVNGTEALEAVGLGDHLDKFPNQLSGGEQQRVSIARAIAKNPALLLCDEPTGALDSATGVTILKLLKEQASRGKTVIIVTHNSLFADIADVVVRLKNGKIRSVTKVEAPMNIDDVEW